MIEHEKSTNNNCDTYGDKGNAIVYGYEKENDKGVDLGLAHKSIAAMNGGHTMANMASVMTPIQFQENLQLQPQLTNHHGDWSGIRGEIRPHLKSRRLNLSGCTDHILTLCLTPLIDAKVNVYDINPLDSKGDGEICLAPAGYSVPWSLGPGRYMYLFIQPAFIAKVSGEAFPLGSNPIKLKSVCHFHNPPLFHMCLAFHNEVSTLGSGNKFYVNSLATTLVVMLLRKYSSVTEFFPEVIPATSGLLPWQWRSVTEHIKANLDGDLSLSELAKVTGISAYHFTRLFKKTSGLSPHQYVMQQRVDQAKQLLSTKRKTILEVCLEVGFLNPAHFATVFHKLVGITPKAFRDKQ